MKSHNFGLAKTKIALSNQHVYPRKFNPMKKPQGAEKSGSDTGLLPSLEATTEMFNRMLHLFKCYDRHVSEEVLQAITEISVVKVFRKNEIILDYGENGGHCYYISDGLVAVYWKWGSSVGIRRFFGDNDICHASRSYCLKRPSDVRIVALEETRCIAISREGEKLICDKHRSASNITQKIIGHYWLQVEKMGMWGTAEPEDRYRACISRLPAFIKRVPDAEMAVFLGMSREELKRIKRSVSNLAK